MTAMERIRKAIREFNEQNGYDYNKMLISDHFYSQLHSEAASKDQGAKYYKVSSTIIDIPRMEIVKNETLDFKLLSEVWV